MQLAQQSKIYFSEDVHHLVYAQKRNLLEHFLVQFQLFNEIFVNLKIAPEPPQRFLENYHSNNVTGIDCALAHGVIDILIGRTALRRTGGNIDDSAARAAVSGGHDLDRFSGAKKRTKERI